MPGVKYWRIQTGSANSKALHGGLTYRAFPDLNGWMVGRAVLCPSRGIHMISAHPFDFAQGKL